MVAIRIYIYIHIVSYFVSFGEYESGHYSLLDFNGRNFAMKYPSVVQGRGHLN